MQIVKRLRASAGTWVAAFSEYTRAIDNLAKDVALLQNSQEQRTFELGILVRNARERIAQLDTEHLRRWDVLEWECTLPCQVGYTDVVSDPGIYLALPPDTRYSRIVSRAVPKPVPQSEKLIAPVSVPAPPPKAIEDIAQLPSVERRQVEAALENPTLPN